MPFAFSRLASASAIVRGAVLAQSFDIKTIDPETFRAIALKITDAQRPDIDGKLTDEVWALAPAQGNFIQREPIRRAVDGEDRVQDPLRRQDALHRRLGVGQRSVRDHGQRDEARCRPEQGRSAQDHHRHVSRSPQRVLLQHQPARRLQGRQHHRERPHHQLRLERGVEQQDLDRRRGWYIEIAIPLSQLRFKTTIGESTWGLNLCRILFRKNEESYWVPFPREWGASGFARVSNAGVLEGLNNIKSRRRIEFVPFLSPKASRDYVAGNGVNRREVRRRLQDRPHRRSDRRLHVSHGLRAGRGRSGSRQPDALQPVLPGEAPVLHRDRRHLRFGKSVTGLGGDAAANDPGLLNIFYSRRIGLVDGQQVPIIGGGR